MHKKRFAALAQLCALAFFISATGTQRVSAHTSDQGTHPAPAVNTTFCVAPARLEVGANEERLLGTQEAAKDQEEARRFVVEVRKLIAEKRYDDAFSAADQLSALIEKGLNIESPEIASMFNQLATLFLERGDYAKSLSLFERALMVGEKVFGPEHPNVASALNSLGMLFQLKGNYEQAELFLQRSLAIVEKTLGADHPNVASALNSLATLYQNKGEYARAESFFQRSLAIVEKSLGLEHPNVAVVLSNLAGIQSGKQDYTQAELLYRRALAIMEKAFGLNHPYVANTLSNLGAVYLIRGDATQAIPLLQRALTIMEKSLGPEHPSIAMTLNNLAVAYLNVKDYAQAEAFFRRALTIREKALGPEHPNVASTLNTLAGIYFDKKDYSQAEAIFRRALTIREKALGPEHPEVALTMSNLGAVSLSQGNTAQAASLLQRSLEIAEKRLGKEHQEIASLLKLMALVHRREGAYTQAVSSQLRANRISEETLARNLLAGSERQKHLYLGKSAADVDLTLSLHTVSAPTDTAAIRMAIGLLSSRKGRVLDAMSDALAQIRYRAMPQDRALLNQYIEALSVYSQAALAGTGKQGAEQHRAYLNQLKEQIERYETEISIRNAEFSSMLQPVTFAAVQNAVPPGGSLVEFASFHPVDARTRDISARRYVAYVINNQGEPSWADLGEAQAIDEQVAALRTALRNPKSAEVKQLARALDEQVMRPVRNLLGETRRVLLSPDGALNLVPFAALVDQNGRYLIENYSFTYLTSGRDLMRLQTHTPSTQEPHVFADPDFGEQESRTAGKARRRATATTGRAFDLSQAYFTPLPATAKEAAALKVILPQAAVLTGNKATEAALKLVKGPQILHIATHGFFLEDAHHEPPSLLAQRLLLQQAPIGTGAFAPVADPGTPSPAERINNPLLRSGLGMAGANRRKSDSNQQNDGILTAMEAAGLNLQGTKLVVLSACDTGVGEVKTGDGVYGLRRALVLAGAETQVMSLWPVSDKGTQELMVDYYRALKDGQERGEGMRQVQLSMLKNPRRQHPYYWASFIVSGDWRKLDEEIGIHTISATQDQGDGEEKQRDLVNQQLKAARNSVVTKAKTSKRPVPKGRGRTRSIEAEELVGITIWRLREQTAVDVQNKQRVLVQQGKRKNSKQTEKPGNNAPNLVAERARINASFEKGDRVQIGLEVGRETGNYLYVIDRELYADGTLSAPYLIYPSVTTPNNRKMISAGKLAMVPAQGDPIPYFTMMPSRDNHVGERLTVIISPTPLKFTTTTEDASGVTLQLLDEKEVSELEAKYALPPKSYESKLSLGQLMTQLELAAGKGTRLMVQKDPLPQTIYQFTGRGEAPLVFSLNLKMKP